MFLNCRPPCTLANTSDVAVVFWNSRWLELTRAATKTCLSFKLPKTRRTRRLISGVSHGIWALQIHDPCRVASKGIPIAPLANRLKAIGHLSPLKSERPRARRQMTEMKGRKPERMVAIELFLRSKKSHARSQKKNPTATS